MTPAQLAAMTMLYTSGFKPQVWGSDASGWRIGPHLIPTRTKRSLERQGWIETLGVRFDDEGSVERLGATAEGRRAFIAAGGNPGQHGRRKSKRGRGR
ncbi:hypothetical protein [Inquilinus sp.]|jgi:hypothetical protein|uniref:hypothetical protein n=1 Tax=Inquilinus sp. TaxID=1932117 RepID=UPI0037844779